jgi:predicted metal-dependent phosphoesterase TrpH
LSLIDLHCHTLERSDDSGIPINEYAALAARRGIDVVCITDHDQFWTPDELEIASAESGVVLIPGSEINTDAGHVICFGVTDYVFGFHRPEKLAAAVLAAGGAAIYAHAYRRNLPPGNEPVSEEQFDQSIETTLGNPLLSWVDALEVANGRGTREQNQFSDQLALTAQLLGVGGSDSHKPDDFGHVATQVIGAIRNVNDLIEALKEGDMRAVEIA